jgi:hypothetical protein
MEEPSDLCAPRSIPGRRDKAPGIWRPTCTQAVMQRSTSQRTCSQSMSLLHLCAWSARPYTLGSLLHRTFTVGATSANASTGTPNLCWCSGCNPAAAAVHNNGSISCFARIFLRMQTLRSDAETLGPGLFAPPDVPQRLGDPRRRRASAVCPSSESKSWTRSPSSKISGPGPRLGTDRSNERALRKAQPQLRGLRGLRPHCPRWTMARAAAGSRLS